MTKQEWKSLDIAAHGLTPDLHVPVAASTLDAIKSYVGEIDTCLHGRKRPINAIVVVAHQPKRNPRVPLWELPDADEYYQRLHPEKQFWVHVDYSGYRRAWERLGFGTLSRDIFLDHVRNRSAVRISGYKHPFVRLCPVSRATNTSSGLNNGAEGLEKIELRKLEQQPEHIRVRMKKALEAPPAIGRSHRPHQDARCSARSLRVAGRCRLAQAILRARRLAVEATPFPNSRGGAWFR